MGSILLNRVPDMIESMQKTQEGLVNKPCHIRAKIKHHSCDICNKTFLRPSHVLRHKKAIHKVDVDIVNNKTSSGKFQCRVCENKFSTVSNRRRHEKKLHKFSPEFKQHLKCSECQSVCQSRNEALLHISTAHPHICMKTENLCFNSTDDFFGWKFLMEMETALLYTLVQSFKTQDYFFQLFKCHQSADLRHVDKGLPKSTGSNKTGFFCPSGIHVKTSVEGSNIDVSFLSTHMGHDSNQR